MADLAKIVDELSSLTVLEAAELAKSLEEKWGVSAAAPVAMMAGAPGGAAAAPAEEKPEFTVVLATVGARKINVIGGEGDHQPWPERGEGPRRRRAEASQGRR